MGFGKFYRGASSVNQSMDMMPQGYQLYTIARSLAVNLLRIE